MLFDEQVSLVGFDRSVNHGFRIDDNHGNAVVAANVADHRDGYFIREPEMIDLCLQADVQILRAGHEAFRVTGD